MRRIKSSFDLVSMAPDKATPQRMRASSTPKHYLGLSLLAALRTAGVVASMLDEWRSNWQKLQLGQQCLALLHMSGTVASMPALPTPDRSPAYLELNPVRISRHWRTPVMPFKHGVPMKMFTTLASSRHKHFPLMRRTVELEHVLHTYPCSRAY